MSGAHWAVLGLLALATFAIRFAGLIAGDRIRTSRHAWLLEDLPGLIVVSLVVSSVAGQPFHYWIAAGLALGIATATNNLIVTMAGGLLVYICLMWLGL